MTDTEPRLVCHPSGGVWARLLLVNGDEIVGPLRFVSYGTIGAYPGWHTRDGSFFPLHAVLEARR